MYILSQKPPNFTALSTSTFCGGAIYSGIETTLNADVQLQWWGCGK